MLIVQKYGGTSVANTEKIFCAAEKIARDYLKNNDMVVVLSAQGNTTDMLLEKADEISKTPAKRELDALLSTGEQQSAALMAMALVEMGLPAISLNSRQAGIFSTSDHGNAKIVSINPDRIKAELGKRNIVIITGFQGIDCNGETTTLGRGASDTTAIALAAALSADLCEIYTDVNGIFTADPRIIKDALKYREVGYNDMLELASMGASVLHSRSVELAQKFGVEFSVKSSGLESELTKIKEFANIEQKLVSGITSDRNICKISIAGVKPEKTVAILHTLAKNKISIDTFTQEVGLKADNLSFSVSTGDCPKISEVLEACRGKIFDGEICTDTNLAKLSVIGAGIAYDASIALVLYETLLSESIKVHLLSLSAAKISALVAEDVVTRAITALHAKFMDAGMLLAQHSSQEAIS